MKRIVSILFATGLIFGLNLYGTITQEVRVNFFKQLMLKNFDDIESMFEKISRDDKNDLVNRTVLDHDEQSILCCAAQEKNLEVVQFMIKHGAHANKKSRIKLSPLYWAAFHGSLDMVKLLVENNAQVNSHTTFVPLCIAAQKGFFDIVQFLIQNEAEVNATESFKVTPLHLAAEWGHCEIVNYLLDNKAKIDAKSSLSEPEYRYCNTPLFEAVRKGYQGRCTCHPKEEFHAPDNIHVVSLLLERGAKINEKCNYYSQVTALHEAARFGCVDMIELLIQWGADCNAQNNEGKTPHDFFVEIGSKRSHVKPDDIERITEMLKPDEISMPIETNIEGKLCFFSEQTKNLNF